MPGANDGIVSTASLIIGAVDYSRTCGNVALSLAVLGGLAARTGRAGVLPGMLRVVSWSALSMAVASGIGYLFGAS